MTWIWMLSTCWPIVAAGASPARIAAEMDVYPQVTLREISPDFTGVLLRPTAANRDLLKQPVVLARIRAMGIKSVYFPAGCVAGTYNWMAPSDGQMKVEEFLDFCDTIGAEACFVLNLQGGTLDLQGDLPGDATFEERIRHRHPLPEGCGGANAHFGTLDEAVALVQAYTIRRALAGKRPLARFVLGHEPWRRATADWVPEVYSGTCEAYCRAMLQAVIDFNEREGGLENVILTFVGVGYPTNSGRSASTRPVDPAVSAAWTRELNRLAGLIDAVQEPFPVFGDGAADAPGRLVQHLTNVIAQRGGVAIERPDGDEGDGLRYDVPLEWAAADPGGVVARPDETPAGGFEGLLNDGDALVVLLGRPTSRVYPRYLIGDDPLALLAPHGDERDRARVFRLLAGRIGEQLVRADLETNAFDLAVAAGESIPVLSATATRHRNDLYVCWVNRSREYPVDARINLRGSTIKPEVDMRTLSADGLASTALAAGNPISHTIPPSSAVVVRMALDQIITTPLLASAERFTAAVRVGENPRADTFTLSTTAVEPEDPFAPILPAPPLVPFAVYVDADWLSVAPSAGGLTYEQPQDIEVSYRAEGLSPGRYAATLTVQSPEAYNCPLKLRVDLTVRTVRADFDGDGDVDGDDFAKFAACMAAPPAIQAGSACAHARLNGDDRVDMSDYYLFESCFSGPNQRPGEGCAE